jgi:hypothetical protein
MTLSMTEKTYVQAAIARVTAKRDAQRDPLCKWYYERCLDGWEAHLKRLG